ncbi:MAG: YaiI/YqxD family protein [Gammaproteobacteria bacterium]|nr:YaiI/YqxD family protein [Gammaproteobacteria bacterium]
MKIWVDADACPVVIREILFRAADRTRVETTFVANQLMRVKPSPFIKSIKVASGFDAADNEIVRRCEAGHLIITADIPLAAEILEKGGHALTPRGERYSVDSIGERLNMRDFMESMRSSGVDIRGGPPRLNQTDRQTFANELDRLLTRFA